MGRLLNTYDTLVKEAEAQRELSSYMELLTKYADVADELLKEEYKSDYTEDDIVELAKGLIDHDAAVVEQAEKVSHYDTIGRELARSVVDEIKKPESKP